MPRPCLPPAVSGYYSRLVLWEADSSRDSFASRTPHRLESFLKLHCTLRVFLPLLLPQTADLYCSLKALLAFPALSSKKSLAYLILVSVPWQTQTNVFSSSLSSQLNSVTHQKQNRPYIKIDCLDQSEKKEQNIFLIPWKSPESFSFYFFSIGQSKNTCVSHNLFVR